MAIHAIHGHPWPHLAKCSPIRFRRTRGDDPEARRDGSPGADSFEQLTADAKATDSVNQAELPKSWQVKKAEEEERNQAEKAAEAQTFCDVLWPPVTLFTFLMILLYSSFLHYPSRPNIEVQAHRSTKTIKDVQNLDEAHEAPPSQPKPIGSYRLLMAGGIPCPSHPLTSLRTTRRRQSFEHEADPTQVPREKGVMIHDISLCTLWKTMIWYILYIHTHIYIYMCVYIDTCNWRMFI